MTEKQILEGAIEKWGPAQQIRKTVEELGELIVALSRPDERRQTEDIAEEIIDVRIMLEQLEIIFSLDPEDLRKARGYKLARLRSRL